MLEAQCHQHSFFSTFTYEVEPNDRTLVKDHISSTMHRLRESARRVSKGVRFFAVGEYGERGGRPHYHAAIFGLGPEDSGLIDRAWKGINDVELRSRAGYVHHGILAPNAANYISGYITKKLTRPDASGLDGRHPEFAVMSRNPGIGLLALPKLIEAFNTSEGARYIALHGDVPSAIMSGGRSLPLGPYVRQKLRLFFFGDSHQPRSGADIRGALDHAEKVLYTSRKLPALPVDSSSLTICEYFNKAEALYKEHLNLKAQQKGKNVAGRHAIYNSGKKL